MKFSVLLPTRNRLDLLKYAVETVLRQDYGNWEIVISDNDSGEDVAGYVRSIGDPRIRYFRTDRLVPVTDNWNNAIEKSTGDYVIMLGDDDGLVKGYFRMALNLIESYGEPDVIYVNSYLYAYPGVLPDHPDGYLRPYGYPAVFGSARDPFFLQPSRARELVRASMDFRLLFGFNMQYSLVSRRIIQSLANRGPFYQSPFPDYYATNVLFLTAGRILVCPTPLVVIGISPKSYGCFYFNRREKEGVDFLNNLPRGDTTRDLSDVLLPGTNMNTFWLLAMQSICDRYGGDYDVRVNYRRYRFLQILNTYGNYYIDRFGGVPESKARESRRQFVTLWDGMRAWEKIVYGPSLWLAYNVVYRIPGAVRNAVKAKLMALLGQYPDFESVKSERGYRTMLEVFEGVDPAAGSLPR